MPAPAHRLRSRPARGFALLITITLLGFLVLLLVSLSALTRVETQVATNARQLAQARQNALLGLNVALGRLQELSGPDQRVTATADVLAGRHPDRKRWTGVWNSDPASGDYGKNIGWLVSGSAPAGTSGMDAAVSASGDEELVNLVDEGSVDTATQGERVRVETQSIKVASIPGLPGVAGGHKIGAFAYWVGDEGVKANISLVDPHAKEAPAGRLYSFLLAQRGAGECIAVADGGAPLGSAYPANGDSLGKLVALRQLPFTTGAATDQAALLSVVRSRFHDLTFNAVSVPADVAAGGLKKDLSAWLSSPTPVAGAPADTDFIIGGVSAADSATDRLPRWGLVRSYAGLADDAGTPIAPVPQTDTTMGVYPVVTYVKLGLALSCEGDDLPLKVHLFPEIVLWNPCNVPLAAGPLKVGVRLQGAITFTLAGEATPKTTLNLTRAALDATGTWPPDYFRFDLDVAAPIEAGSSVVFTPAASEAGYGTAAAVLRAESPPNRGGSLVLTGPVMTASERAKNVTWGSPGGGEIYVALWPGSSPATSPDDALQATSRVGTGSPGTPTSAPVPEAVIAPVVQWRIQANMSRNTYAPSPRWIAQLNLRAPVIDRSGAETGTLPLFYCLANSGASLPTIEVDGNLAAAGLSVSRIAGSADRLTLFELRPSGVPLVSLAELQHADLAPAGYYPSYAAGNSLPDPAILNLGDISRKDAGWARGVHDVSYGLNAALWDRYFLSTVPASLTAADRANSDYHLPNARYRFDRDQAFAPSAVAGSAAFHTAAAHLWLDGGFNVNSTSVEAWKALLAARHGLEYDPVARTTGPALGYPFSRFTVPTGGANQPWAGYRDLSAGAVEWLAERIVEQVKARAPFLSLADFVNRRLVDNPATPADERLAGTLQAALDAHDLAAGLPVADRINLLPPFDADAVSSGAGTDWDIKLMQGGDAPAFPRSSRSAFAPGYLTQADILSGIGPMLTARSDTFTIRAYGDVRNPVTGDVEGRAWCEAVVQRLHEFVNTADTAETWPATQPENVTFGRRYRVVSFRWLSQKDL